MLSDQHGRPLASLRLSVTDRCNLRCSYCMPESDYAWLPESSILSPDELARVARVFSSLGVRKVRLTGGEPLLRPELSEIVRRIASVGGVGEVALTTNGVLFAEQAAALRDAGLKRVTFSLDTLDAARAKELSRTTRLADVFAGLERAYDLGYRETKINTVVMRGINDDELVKILDFGRRVDAEVRFLEYMDVGGATHWSMSQVVPKGEILAHLEKAKGKAQPLGTDGPAPATRYRLADGTTFGIVASTTEPFCMRCDRARVTADGVYFPCLYAEKGIDLRTRIRQNASDDELAQVLEEAWRARNDRGAEVRAALKTRDVLIPASRLRENTHWEMHTRGG